MSSIEQIYPSIIIDGRNQTDETECEQWLCNNTYTRCNDLWNCLNREDEVDCDPSPPLNCSSNEYICISPRANQLQLDAILGYHMQSNVRIIQQMSMALVIIFIIVGFINGILSMITFKKKSIWEVECGWYLLGSSITTLY
jgi:hypothetical protein